MSNTEKEKETPDELRQRVAQDLAFLAEITAPMFAEKLPDDEEE